MDRNVQWSPAAARGPSSSITSMSPSLGTPVVLQGFYTLEFDGASKGNPGQAGAGALLRDPGGAEVLEVTEGLGRATNNVAEYRALIAGLRAALDLGVQNLIVRGDSELVCKQRFNLRADELANRAVYHPEGVVSRIPRPV